MQHTDPQAERSRHRQLTERIAHDFTYHPPRMDQQARYDVLRAHGRALAEVIARETPHSREQSLAITRVEEAIMWANAAISRNEGAGDGT